MIIINSVLIVFTLSALGGSNFLLQSSSHQDLLDTD